MSSIFACKMYLNSKNKDKIRAAAEAPINQELVLQLKTYLGDDALAIQQETERQKAAEVQEEISKLNKGAAFELGDRNSPGGSPRPMGGAPMGGAPSEEFDLPEDGEGELPELDDSNASFSAEAESTSTESATKITKLTPINACTQLLVEAAEEIKGLLNSREDTAGVERLGFKDDSEFWIYYNDDVNLNSVMSKVIDLMFAAGYTMLTFNRLARSNNAIVFTYGEELTVVAPSNETQASTS